MERANISEIIEIAHSKAQHLAAERRVSLSLQTDARDVFIDGDLDALARMFLVLFDNAVKYTPTGLIDRYKARLVAQGFSQVPGDDFLETFSPTIRAESLRVLLAIGACEDLEIRQIDVVSAYPRSKLHATIYIRLTPELRELVGIQDPNKVLKLNQALYGLKQSGREWYIEACRGLKTIGFEPLFSEPSIF